MTNYNVTVGKDLLPELLSGQHGQLSRISIDGENKSALLKLAEEEFEQAKKELIAVLEADDYAGSDRLPLNRALLDSLEIPFSISSEHDLNLLLQATPAEIERLLREIPALVNQIMALFTRLEDIVIFIINTPTTKLPVLLDFLMVDISYWLHDSLDVAALLISLTGEKFRITLRAFQDTIQSIPVILQIIDALPSEQRADFFEVMKAPLLELLKNAQGFDMLMNNLSDSERSAVFHAVREKLPGWLKRASDYHCIIRYLSPENRNYFFDTVKEKASETFKTIHDIFGIMGSLPADEQDDFFEVTQERVLEFLVDTYSFAAIMRYLPERKQDAFVETVAEKLFELCDDVSDFDLIMDFLSPRQGAIFLDCIKGRLPELLQESCDLDVILKYLTHEHDRNVFLYAAKGRWDALLQDLEDFECITRHLPLESKARRAFFE